MNVLQFFAETKLNVFERGQKNPLPEIGAGDAQVDQIVNVIFGLAGALALLFIVIGGLRYIMSQGDPNNTSRAKGTVLYALIGLVVTITAYGIVRFVVRTVG